MKVVPKLLNNTELSDALGIGKEQLRKLRAEGLPATRKSNRLQFDPEAVFTWLVSTNRHKHANRIAGLLPQKPASDGKKATPSGEIDDLDKFVERVRFNECALFEDVQNATDAAMRGYSYGNYKDACKQRLDVEKEIARIQLSQQRSIPVDEVNRHSAELGSLVKSKLMSWIGKLPPLLHEKDMAEMGDILDAEVREILEDLAR